MDDVRRSLDELRNENAELRTEIERLRTMPEATGVSRRQLLMGGAGVLGAVAGAGLLSGNRPALAAGALDSSPTTDVGTTTSVIPAMIFMKVLGDGSNLAPGPVSIKGFEGSIAVLELHHSFDDAYDQVSGQASGKRQHKPFVIIKQTDQASPKLYNLFHNDQNNMNVQFFFVRPDTKAGTLRQFFTVQLTNANIVSMAFHDAPRDGLDPLHLDLYEVVQFTYQKIVWTWTQGNITASDDWEVPAP